MMTFRATFSGSSFHLNTNVNFKIRKTKLLPSKAKILETPIITSLDIDYES